MTWARNKDESVERQRQQGYKNTCEGGGNKVHGWQVSVQKKDIVNSATPPAAERQQQNVGWRGTKIGNGVPLSRQIHLMLFLMEGITLKVIYCVTVICIRI